MDAETFVSNPNYDPHYDPALLETTADLAINLRRAKHPIFYEDVGEVAATGVVQQPVPPQSARHDVGDVW